jgi:CubicO group peptidase (beta-lactamase class C family)
MATTCMAIPGKSRGSAGNNRVACKINCGRGRAALRILAASLLLAAALPAVASDPLDRQIDAYLAPYVQTGNFSGVALVRKGGHTLFHKAYGFSDRVRGIQNSKNTRFHIASVSMQFTAAAVLRLADQGALNLDAGVGEYLQGTEGAGKITVRDLLLERSGLPDINGLPEYGEILQQHQTPASLVAKIRGRPLLFEPGSKFLHEEHSAYNLLALIVERKTGRPFAEAMQRLVFKPAGLKLSGIDDDSMTEAAGMARGYEPTGVNGLKGAVAIHWSGKAGNASVYAAAADEAKWVQALLSGRLLRSDSREALLGTSPRVGYGWFRGENKRFHETAYYMNGRAPGFASFVLYLPDQQLTVVVFSNIYSSATTAIGYDIAAIALGAPYTQFQPRKALAAAEAETCAGSFQFGQDFYQPNGRVVLRAEGTNLLLRWPSGDISPLIPLEHDHFMDRSYWEDVRLERDATGKPVALLYGSFRGHGVRE